MDDLFLRVRLEALEKNLRKVKALVQVVRTNTLSVRKLHEEVAAPAAPTTVNLRRVTDDVYNIVKVLNYEDVADYLSGYKMAAKVENAQQSLVDLASTLDAVKNLVDDLVVNLKETDTLLNREHVKNLFGVGVTDRLLGDTVKLKLDLAKSTTDDLESSTSNPWQRYRDLVGDRDQVELFQEYVDVAAGISLRGTGMDEHFCAMADWLSDHWTAVVNLPYWFAIPASQQRSAIPNIIRLGFPEWTIWALPLFAHELGRILTTHDPDFEQLATDLSKTVVSAEPSADAAAVDREREFAISRFKTYFADVFATYIMGPAYACACLLLRLDPAAGADQPPEYGRDLVRAEVVLKTLKAVDPGVQSELSVIGKTIRDSWEAAVKQLGPAEANNPEQAFAAEIVENVVGILKLIEERNQTDIVFGEVAWSTAKQQAEEYFASLPPVAESNFPIDGVTLPHVLNAAWYWRLDREPTRASDIAQRVREDIWPRLKAPAPDGLSNWKHASSGIRP